MKDKNEDNFYQIKGNFYEDLEAVYNSLPLHCVMMILGYLNAKVGKESSFRRTIEPGSLHNTSNENGIRLVDFACSKDFIISSTYLPRKDIYKHTWKSPDGRTHNQIDHILINKRYSSCIQKLRTYTLEELYRSLSALPKVQLKTISEIENNIEENQRKIQCTNVRK